MNHGGRQEVCNVQIHHLDTETYLPHIVLHVHIIIMKAKGHAPFSASAFFLIEALMPIIFTLL